MGHRDVIRRIGVSLAGGKVGFGRSSLGPLPCGLKVEGGCCREAGTTTVHRGKVGDAVVTGAVEGGNLSKEELWGKDLVLQKNTQF